MKHYLIILLVVALAGCTTINPETGLKEFDPVKTAKVKALIKPMVSGTVSAVIAKHEDSKIPFEKAAANICALRDSGSVTLSTFREAVNSAFQDYGKKVDPIVAGGINTLIAIFEINYADRLRADLPEEEYAWNILDVLCDGIGQGILMSGSP